MGFIFGGDTGETQASIKRKRRIANALARRVAGPTPRNIGEGIGLVGQALASRFIGRKADRAEREGQDKATAAFNALLGTQQAQIRPGDAGPGVIGTPQAPTAPNTLDGLDPRMMALMGDPFASPGQQAVLRALMQQRMAATAPITPYQTAVMEAQKAARDQVQGNADRTFGLAQGHFGLARSAANKRDIIEDANGRKRYADTGEFVFEDFEAVPEPGFTQLTAEEAATLGLPEDKVFQKGPDGRITQIGGGGVTVNTGDILGSQQPSLGPAPETVQPPEPDVTPAFGLKGMAKNVVNAASDFVGWGLVWPKADRAKRALTSLKTETVLGFKSLVNQRLSNQMITAFEALTSEAGSGKEGALTQFKQTRELLQRAFNNNAEVTANPENFLPKAVSDAGKDGIALKGILDRYNAIIENFDSSSQAAPQAAPQTTGDSAADAIMDQLLRDGDIQ